MIEVITQNAIFQNTTMMAILLIIGLAILVVSAEKFVDGASNIAYNYKIPAVIVGLTIVAFGTSAPEAATSLTLLNSNPAEVIGNVVGSNVFNILGVIGISTLFGAIAIDKDLIKRDFPFLIISTIGFLIIVQYIGKIDFYIGIIFLIIIFAYVIYLVIKTREDKEEMAKEGEITLTIKKATIYTIIGLIGIIIASKIIGTSTEFIVSDCNLKEGIIGYTAIALSTSLPELISSLNALKKGENGMVVGNVLGSCIFNILFILGICGVFGGIKLENCFFDVLFMTVITIVGAAFAYTKNEISKKEGVVLILLYVAFLIYIYIKTGSNINQFPFLSQIIYLF